TTLFRSLSDRQIILKILNQSIPKNHPKFHHLYTTNTRTHTFSIPLGVSHEHIYSLHQKDLFTHATSKPVTITLNNRLLHVRTHQNKLPRTYTYQKEEGK